MAILGSPQKKGNSSLLAKVFLDKAERAGAKVRIFHLEKMSYKGCKGCGACKKKSDKCVIKDDLAETLEEMHKSDIILMASPNYFSDISGQLKLFIDRTFSLLTPQFMSGPERSRLPKGKKLVFILTQGASEEAFKEIPEKYSQITSYFGYEEFHTIRGCNLMESGEVKNRPELIAKTEELADKLLAGAS
jgi:multimeric flavodoxin WrbA